MKCLKTLKDTYNLGPGVSRSFSALVKHITNKNELQGFEMMQLKERMATFEEEKADKEYVST